MENVLILHHPFFSHLLHNILIMQMRINILDVITLCVPHYSLGYSVTDAFFAAMVWKLCRPTWKVIVLSIFKSAIISFK